MLFLLSRDDKYTEKLSSRDSKYTDKLLSQDSKMQNKTGYTSRIARVTWK